MPYYDDYGYRLADLMRQRGDRAAAAHLQRGDAQAQMWFNAGNAINNSIAGWQRDVEMNRQRELEMARESRRAEAEGMQLEASRLSLGRAKRQEKGAEFTRQILPLARRENGVVGYDRDVLAREYEAAGMADLWPEVSATLDEQESAYFQVQEARRDAIARDAWRVLQSGGDDQTFDAMLNLWEENDLAPKREIEALRKAGKERGTQAALMAAVQSSPKLMGEVQKMQEASAPKPHNVPEGATVIDERTGQVMYQGQPKTPSNIEQAILQETDPAKRLELIRMKEQFAAAGRAPIQPRESEPLVPVMGDDGKPVLLPRSQAAGRQPASTREQGRQVTSGDAGDIADFNSALDELAAVRAELEGNDATGTAAQIGAALWNPITNLTGWGTEAKQKQAIINRVKQVIGKALEGGVLRKEDEIKYSKILPTIGDNQDVVTTKINGLVTAVKQRQQRKLEALSDAGYDVSRYEQRAPESGGPMVGERRLINGQLGEWDGTGWRAVR